MPGTPAAVPSILAGAASLWLLLLLPLPLPAAAEGAGAQADGYGPFGSVKFIQYLDENTALEEVRNGNLDMYYYRIPSDRLEDRQSREGLQVFDSAGGSYSILVNPAESDRFNPFSDRDVRFALNYLVDRRLIVNELMGGYGSPITSYYGPSDPEYLTVLGQLEGFNFAYNPALAEGMISSALAGREGASRTGGTWHVGGDPVEVTIFIRSDDPVRKSIGEILASELERIGFVVHRDFGDLNKAFVVVYGSDPADMEWHLYTEGWGRSAFVRYDSVGLGQMYAPWFSSMPGFNDPSYWNYQNEVLDDLTQRIYTGDFGTERERAGLIREAVAEGIGESVRVFLASNTDQYVAGAHIDGIVNDFGAGVPSRFTPINARGQGDELVIGVKQIYQGAWNPVMGLTDSYSRHIWGVVADPGAFKHPFTGETFPVRADWRVQTAGPGGALELPPEAITWSPESQAWVHVAANATATSRVTFDLELGGWHNGQAMDMNDILHSLYFTVEWGTRTGEGDRTFDAEFTPRAAQGVQTIVGVNPVDADTIEVYVDYWHFDEGEIAGWADLWSQVPWEVTAAMEAAVVDGKASFSRSGATAKGTDWLSLLVPGDAHLLGGYLRGFAEAGHVPPALSSLPPHVQQRIAGGQGEGDGGGGAEGPGYREYHRDRYGASAGWIDANGHAVISNGPFYLESYSPEARTITVAAFGGDSGQGATTATTPTTPTTTAATAYPFERDRWAEFESARLPSVTGVAMDDFVPMGGEMRITVKAEHSDRILYFLTAGDGRVVSSGEAGLAGGGGGGGDGDDGEDTAVITVPAETVGELGVGACTVKIFAVSDSVLKPDMYESGFFVTGAGAQLPGGAAGDSVLRDGTGAAPVDPAPAAPADAAAAVAAMAAAAAAGVGAYCLLRRRRRRGHERP